MKIKKKLASMLIAAMMFELPFSGGGMDQLHVFGCGLGIRAEASQMNKASGSESSRKTASSSQSIRAEIKQAELEEDVEYALELKKTEIVYGEYVDFTFTGEDQDNQLYFEAVNQDDRSQTEELIFWINKTDRENAKKEGTLRTDALSIGKWVISAYLDDGNDAVAEAVLTVKQKEYFVTFLKMPTKQLGEKDPTYITTGEVSVTDQSENVVCNFLNDIEILREPGEDPGIYKITEVKDTLGEKQYTVIDNEFAKLEIQKRTAVNRNAVYYMDANNNRELTVDLIAHKDVNGEFSIPQDIKNPRIIVGDLGEMAKNNLDGNPAVDQNQVTVKLHTPITAKKIPVPFVIQSDNYQDLVFTLDLRVDYLEEHTKEEIKSFYQSHPFQINGRVTYKENPGFSPYTAGRVSKESEEDGLNALNFIRYIAGIYPKVTADDELVNYAQTASVLLARINELTHDPYQPSDMPDDFYQVGAQGAGSSNIAWHSAGMSLSYTIIDLYMDDGDASNIDRVGHRRWCLNPDMRYTGFGYYRNYSALYAFDSSGREERTEGYVPWPAKNMPYDYFRGPWSIQFSSDSYTVDDQVKVTLTTSSGKTLVFGKDDADGYFAFDGNGYGMGSAVIFQPSVSIGKNETVQVHVTGLHRPDGTEAEIHYTVEFFSMSGSDENSNSGSGGSGGGSSGGGGSGGSGGGSSGGGGGSRGGSSGGRTGTGVTYTGPSVSTLQIINPYVYSGIWSFDGLKWHLLLSDGSFAAGRWACLDGRWYVFDHSGCMLTGWQNINNIWYYLNADGSMAVGWILDNGKWYYLGTDGAMLSNTVTPDGYMVGADGAWIR